MIVIFDTNIWVRHLFLRSSAAAARFFIVQRNAGVLALPEVIRLEVEHHLRKEIRGYVAQIETMRSCSRSSGRLRKSSFRTMIRLNRRFLRGLPVSEPTSIHACHFHLEPQGFFENNNERKGPKQRTIATVQRWRSVGR